MEHTICESRQVRLDHNQCADVFKAYLEQLCQWNTYEIDEQGTVWLCGASGHNGDSYRERKVGKVTDSVYAVMQAARTLRTSLKHEKRA